MKYTHAGWFGLCPVYIAGLESDAPLVEPRHWVCAPLFWLSLWANSVVFWCCSVMDPTFEPQWPLKITAKLGGQE